MNEFNSAAEMLSALEKLDRSSETFIYEAGIIVPELYGYLYDHAEDDETADIFCSLWDWYLCSEDGAYQIYEGFTDKDCTKVTEVISKYGGSEMGEMFESGLSDAPEEMTEAWEKIDAYTEENAPLIMGVIIDFLLDNSNEISALLDSEIFTLSLEERNKRLGIIEQDIPPEAGLDAFPEDVKNLFQSMMNSGCDNCVYRLDNNAANELCCKAFPEGVPENILLSPAESKRNGCANGYSFKEE